MLSRTLGVAVALAIVALVLCPMAIYENQPYQKRRLGKAVITALLLSTILYRADGGHWVFTDVFLLIGLTLLWMGFAYRGLLSDGVVAMVFGVLALCIWSVAYPGMNGWKDIVAVLLGLGVVMGGKWCLQAYVSYPPKDPAMLLFKKETR